MFPRDHEARSAADPKVPLVGNGVTQGQNMTGHPAVSVPAGRSADGVPFGFQITGPRFRDHLVLDVAAAWERAEPWPLTATGYSPFDLP
jgi:Asp-tRNA(Asn)/Glu-tRNA(Gln) amidotransferase A subunit family amidase